jgi:protein phosphatase
VHEKNDDHYLVLRLAQHLDTLLTSLAGVDRSISPEEHAYAAVVADGIGHAGAGSVAARLAITTLVNLAYRVGQWNLRLGPESAAGVIERSEWLYRQASDTVLRRSQDHVELTGMAAALTGIYSVGTDLFVAHVGHSRCYLFRDGVLVQLTRDHTLREHRANSQYPVSLGQVVDDVKHILTHAIGAALSGPNVIVEHFRLADDDSLLLCTNGVTDVVSDDVIADVLASRRTPSEQSDQLVDLALANGAQDNATAVIVNYRVPEIQADPA